MICCITGHRPEGFPFERKEENPSFMLYKKKLKEELIKLANDGFTHFISGMAEGADIDFAEVVLEYKGEKSLILEAALPCPYQAKKKTKRSELLSVCNVVSVVSEYYFGGCMQKRNRYMVDKCDLVLAVWNGKESGGTWNTISYARTVGKNVRYIMLNTICEDKA